LKRKKKGGKVSGEKRFHSLTVRRKKGKKNVASKKGSIRLVEGKKERGDKTDKKRGRGSI